SSGATRSGLADPRLDHGAAALFALLISMGYVPLTLSLTASGVSMEFHGRWAVATRTTLRRWQGHPSLVDPRRRDAPSADRGAVVRARGGRDDVQMICRVRLAPRGTPSGPRQHLG